MNKEQIDEILEHGSEMYDKGIARAIEFVRSEGKEILANDMNEILLNDRTIKL